MLLGTPILILNQPKYMGNVGMICRLISNFALEPLRILGEPFERNLEMEWMAHGAKEELEKIQFFTNYWECTKDLELVIGTGIIHGSDRAQFIRFETLKENIKGKRFGVIFGREDTGIQKNVSELCDFMIDFELPGAQNSMNLAQAVAYFLGRITQENEFVQVERPSKLEVNKTHFLSYAQKVFGILGMNHFHGSENLAVKRFKKVLRFSELSQRDINFLFKVFRAIEAHSQAKENNEK